MLNYLLIGFLFGIGMCAGFALCDKISWEYTKYKERKPKMKSITKRI